MTAIKFNLNAKKKRQKEEEEEGEKEDRTTSTKIFLINIYTTNARFPIKGSKLQ